jgi:uncharacterized protein (TIGR02147 family)
MNVFEFKDYKKFVNAHIETLPQHGRGEFRKISIHLSMHSTTVSQIFNGDKNLTLEQAADLCGYLHLSELEVEYFLALVQLARSGSINLCKNIEIQLERLRKEHQQLVHRLKNNAQFESEVQAIFYSNWYYAAIRVLSSIPGYQDVSTLTKRLQLPVKTVNQAVKFLIQSGLCVLEEGKIVPGPRRTHLGADSPFVNSHRLSWHLKALEKLKDINEESLVYSAPLSIGQDEKEKAREILIEAIKRITDLAAQSDPADAVILNIDWLNF